ncbi:MAG: tRNA (adenosine(37)-N6)-threonylcarbamoyltransferase complex ATPase subunit type 1 TsaE [Clostridiales bacterium]|jgi:tRNA threonylcarbamoyladenosine biosynthesis protein TsaE|nr:tRNA (adenosine(37)-N6)-threonylcarbamoyltransferase complex ATPase subunit type 1 TsaE [Clostridiales bacterium]
MIFMSYSQRETEEFGATLAAQAVGGSFYALIGDLGAGKTAFARGFARGLGVACDISSPTFAIINEYSGRLPLYHFDVYRIGHLEEMGDTGYEEYFYGGGVVLVEWADLIRDFFPPNAVIIEFERIAEFGDDFRRIVVKK